MTAVVGREQAKAAYLTGTAGALVLVVAFVMMVLAAPSRSHAGPHGAATPKPSARTLSHVTQTLPPAVIPRIGHR
jgi:hypothetical protein